jgi:hypothetical protein
MKGVSRKQPVISQIDAAGIDIPGISQQPQLLGMGASSAGKAAAKPPRSVRKTSSEI